MCFYFSFKSNFNKKISPNRIFKINGTVERITALGHSGGLWMIFVDLKRGTGRHWAQPPILSQPLPNFNSQHIVPTTSQGRIHNHPSRVRVGKSSAREDH